MNNITLSFGKRIRNLRSSKKISQEKLAELSGLHPTYIGQLERGEKSPTLESIYKLSEGLGMSLEELFSKFTATDEQENYAIKVYDLILSLSDEKKERVYKILCDILQL